jgi:hypothetical protein
MVIKSAGNVFALGREELGAELAEAVHKIAPALPIVLATGNAELPHGSASGLTRLSKPFTQFELDDAASCSGAPV